MYETILVPTDGSDHARRAAEHALAIGRLFDATVHFLAVADIETAAGVFLTSHVDEEFVARVEADAEETLDAVTALAGDEDRIETARTNGDPTERILEYAADHGVDLVAMGTHGRTGIERYVAGSVTERVLRRADVPVLTVRASDVGRPAGAYDEVLVPTDGSDPAGAAVEPALALAERTGARIHAVTVINVSDLIISRGAARRQSVLDALHDAGEAATEAVATRARERGLEATTAVFEGVPARDLLDYAGANDVDLIAMGTTGRTGAGRYLLGSTTERVVRHADAVLAVNARGERDADEE